MSNHWWTLAFGQSEVPGLRIFVEAKSFLFEDERLMVDGHGSDNPWVYVESGGSLRIEWEEQHATGYTVRTVDVPVTPDLLLWVARALHQAEQAKVMAS